MTHNTPENQKCRGIFVSLYKDNFNKKTMFDLEATEICNSNILLTFLYKVYMHLFWYQKYYYNIQFLHSNANKNLP